MTARIFNVLLGTWLFLSAFAWPHPPAQGFTALVCGALTVLLRAGDDLLRRASLPDGGDRRRAVRRVADVVVAALTDVLAQRDLAIAIFVARVDRPRARRGARAASASSTAGSEPRRQLTAPRRAGSGPSVPHVVAGVAAGILLQVVLVVRLGRRPRPRVDNLGDDRVLPAPRLAARAPSPPRRSSAAPGDVTKIADRYCEPTSLPWRFFVVGSCMRKNHFSSRSAYVSLLGSNTTRTASAWPVVPS